jgi:hypothetical protein
MRITSLQQLQSPEVTMNRLYHWLVVFFVLVTLVSACGTASNVPSAGSPCLSDQVRTFDAFLEKQLADFSAAWTIAAGWLQNQNLFSNPLPTNQAAKPFLDALRQHRAKLSAYSATGCTLPVKDAALAYQDNAISLFDRITSSPSSINSDRESAKANALYGEIQKARERMRDKAR